MLDAVARIRSVAGSGAPSACLLAAAPVYLLIALAMLALGSLNAVAENFRYLAFKNDHQWRGVACIRRAVRVLPGNDPHG